MGKYMVRRDCTLPITIEVGFDEVFFPVLSDRDWFRQGLVTQF